MMFLLRATFWLGLVLVLLPTGPKKQDIKEPQVNIADAASAATSAVADLSQFCTRRPDTCAVGSRIAAALGQRAKAGAVMVYDLIAQRSDTDTKEDKVAPARHDGVAEARAAQNADTTGSIGARILSAVMPAALMPRPRPGQSQDTLTTSDRQSAWRRPAGPQTQVAAAAR